MILLKLFFTFFKIGLFTFGGGYAMLPLIEEEVVRNGWMDTSDLVNFIAVSESTPGPFAVNVSTYVGCEVAGVLGSLCATLGVIMPSFIVILVVAKCFEKFKENKHVQAVFYGLRPAVAGLITAACYGVMAISLFSPDALAAGDFMGFLNIKACALFAVMLWAVMKFKKHPVVYIAICAVLGIIIPF